jgi:hypothetical protein
MDETGSGLCPIGISSAEPLGSSFETVPCNFIFSVYECVK